MVTAVSVFTLFTYDACLFCLHIVVNIMEFYATFIQGRGLVAIKLDLIHPFLH